MTVFGRMRVWEDVMRVLGVAGWVWLVGVACVMEWEGLRVWSTFGGEPKDVESGSFLCLGMGLSVVGLPERVIVTC